MSKTTKIDKPGFLLIELLIAIAIMTMVWFIIARYQGNILSVTHNTQQRIKATNLAMRLLDSGEFDTQNKEIDGFTVTWSRSRKPFITPLGFNQNQSLGIDQFNLVTVHVAWNHNGHTQSVQLMSGFIKEQS